MPIAANTKVSIHYTLKDDEGNIIDSSAGKEPLDYIQGRGMIVRGLEKALETKDVGDKFSVDVSPAEGYGEYNNELVRTLPKNMFQADEVKPGMVFFAQTPAGAIPLRIQKVEEDLVTIDMNHELAGKVLHFDIEVLSASPLSEEELKKLEEGDHHCCGKHGDGECCGKHKHENGEHHCCHGEGDENGEHHCCHENDENGEHHCCHGEGDESGEHHCHCKDKE